MLASLGLRCPRQRVPCPFRIEWTLAGTLAGLVAFECYGLCHPSGPMVSLGAAALLSTFGHFP